MTLAEYEAWLAAQHDPVLLRAEALERMRVNVGLVTENAELKRRTHQGELRDLRLAYDALRKMVLDESPQDLPVSADIWGDATSEQVEAIRRLETRSEGGS